MRSERRVNIFKSKKRVKVFAIAAAVLIAVGALISASNVGAADTENQTVIKEAQAKTGNVAKTISASGTLSDNAGINIRMPAGVKINEVCVSAGDTVKKGAVLAKVDRASVAAVILELEEEQDDVEDSLAALSDTSDTTSDDYLKKIVYDSELSDIASAISKLRDMLDSGTITATKSGTVTSVNVSDGDTVSQQSSSSESSSSDASMKTASSTSTTSGSGTITFASYTTGASLYTGTASYTTGASSNTGTTSYTTGASSNTGTTGLTLLDVVTEEAVEAGTVTTDESASTETTEAKSNSAKSLTLTSDSETSEQDGIITTDDLVTLMVTAPSDGQMPQQRVASTSKYNSEITWSTDSAFRGGSKYSAVIELTSKSGYMFTDASSYDIEFDGGSYTAKVTGGDESGNKLVIKVTYTAEGGSSGSGSGSKSGGSASGGSSGSNGNNSSGSISRGSTGVSSGGSTSSGSSTGTTTSSSAELTADAVDMVTVFSMSSDDEMTVEVSVDESDINSVKTGQTATVTLDAVEGESFDAEITKVSSTASSSSGGNVKYSVTLTLDKTDDMKEGMTASAVINIEEANDVIVIPSAAIHEKNGKVYVYTKKDGDELSGETEVTTGLSNGSMVEVQSGLNEGDTVYYQVKTSTSGSSDRSSEKGEMGGMMPGENGGPGEMGERPDFSQGGGPGNGSSNS